MNYSLNVSSKSYLRPLIHLSSRPENDSDLKHQLPGHPTSWPCRVSHFVGNINLASTSWLRLLISILVRLPFSSIPGESRAGEEGKKLVNKNFRWQIRTGGLARFAPVVRGLRSGLGLRCCCWPLLLAVVLCQKEMRERAA